MVGKVGGSRQFSQMDFSGLLLLLLLLLLVVVVNWGTDDGSSDAGGCGKISERSDTARGTFLYKNGVTNGDLRK